MDPCPVDGDPPNGILLRGEVPKLVAAATLVAIASTSIASTVPRGIADEPGRGTTDPAIGLALATFSLAAAAGGVAGARLANRVGSARLLRVSLLAAALPASALAFATPATAASFLALLLTGFLIGPAIPLLLVAAQNEAPERAATASGMIMGLSHGLAGVAFIGVSVIIGTAGYGAGLLTGAAALVPAAFIVRTRHGAARPTFVTAARCVIATCRCVVDQDAATPAGGVMDTPRQTAVMRRLESARSATELTTSVLSVTLQLVTLAAIVRPALRAFTRGARLREMTLSTLLDDGRGSRDSATTVRRQTRRSL